MLHIINIVRTIYWNCNKELTVNENDYRLTCILFWVINTLVAIGVKYIEIALIIHGM